VGSGVVCVRYCLLSFSNAGESFWIYTQRFHHMTTLGSWASRVLFLEREIRLVMVQDPMGPVHISPLALVSLTIS